MRENGRIREGKEEGCFFINGQSKQRGELIIKQGIIKQGKQQFNFLQRSLESIGVNFGDANQREMRHRTEEIRN